MQGAGHPTKSQRSVWQDRPDCMLHAGGAAWARGMWRAATGKPVVSQKLECPNPWLCKGLGALRGGVRVPLPSQADTCSCSPDWGCPPPAPQSVSWEGLWQDSGEQCWGCHCWQAEPLCNWTKNALLVHSFSHTGLLVGCFAQYVKFLCAS